MESLVLPWHFRALSQEPPAVVLPLGSIVLVACRRDSKSDVLPLWYGPNQDRAPGGSFVGTGHLAGPPLSGGELFTRARPFLHDGSDPGGCRVTREYCRQGWALPVAQGPMRQVVLFQRGAGPLDALAGVFKDFRCRRVGNSEMRT